MEVEAAAFTTKREPITAKVINQLINGLQPCISDVSVKWGKAYDFEGSCEVVTKVVKTKKTLFGFGKTKKEIKQKSHLKFLQFMMALG